MFNVIKKNNYSSNTLNKVLINQGKIRWLDIGCGGNFEPGFHYLDYSADISIPEDCKGRYFKINILELTDDDCKKTGCFDLLRMQHVFEHFTPEEGSIVLKNCARLLNPDGFLLITVPDLRKFIKYYKKNSFKKLYTFYHWALNRIQKNAPSSFFFSIYTHSLLHEQHKWCYDEEGLKYVIDNTGIYKNIKTLTFKDKLANQPYTHNRPLEDICVIANLK